MSDGDRRFDRGRRRGRDHAPHDAGTSAFAALGLESRLLRGVEAAGYERPTPIQERAIPSVLAGRDIVGSAQTGTGKTAAFVLPLLQLLMDRSSGGGESRQGEMRRSSHGAAVARPRALVVTPTRELAGQIATAAREMGVGTRQRVEVAYGGVPYDAQARRLRSGVDMLVATPGRLLDMVDRGDVDLGAVGKLVLDEADRMLDMGFLPAIKRILKLLPGERQNLLFSATMSRGVLAVIEHTLSDPIFIKLGLTTTPVEAVAQLVLPVPADQKLDLLLAYFRQHEPGSTLIFTRTRHRADRLARTLARHDLSCSAIHGDRTQNQRQRALRAFRSGEVRVLVATDVVARGIDVDGITHVINYDIPTNPEDYVHRIGRTARAGASGTAISLLSPEEADGFQAVERFIKARVERHSLPGFRYEEGGAAHSMGGVSRGGAARGGGTEARPIGVPSRRNNGRAGSKSARRAAEPAQGNRPRMA